MCIRDSTRARTDKRTDTHTHKAKPIHPRYARCKHWTGTGLCVLCKTHSCCQSWKLLCTRATWRLVSWSVRATCPSAVVSEPVVSESVVSADVVTTDGSASSKSTSAARTVLPRSFLTAGWIGVGFDASIHWLCNKHIHSSRVTTQCLTA